MSLLRQDSLTGRWVILAARRLGRPNEFAIRPEPGPCRSGASDDCPFCHGNEIETPAEVLALGRDPFGAPDSPGWTVRVFPNKFPAVQENPTSSFEGQAMDDDLFPSQPARGGHEVVACGGDHATSLAHLSRPRMLEIFQALQLRVSAMADQLPSARYVLVFGNQGPEAGATLSHPHIQIIATEVVPVAVQEKVQAFEEHHQRTGRCLLCETMEKELRAGERMVGQNAHAVAWAPWASRYAQEMRLVPRRHCSSLSQMTDEERDAMASLLHRCLQQLEAGHPSVGFNLILHGEPLADSFKSGYDQHSAQGSESRARGLFHWHLEILPRLSRLAGFEAGSGYAINSLPPEKAAQHLRFEGE